MRRFIQIGSLILLTLTTACSTSIPWKNIHLPETQWGNDWRECQVTAQNDTGHLLGFADLAPQGLRTSGPIENYERDKTAKTITRYTNACMRGKGYTPVKDP